MGGGRKKGSRMTPSEYIRSAIELHLQADMSDNPSTLVALEKFLYDPEDQKQGEEEEQSPAPRLLVWIPRSTEDDDETALASTEQLDGNNLGALAFINTSASTTTNSNNNSSMIAPIRNASQVQCMMLHPRIYVSDNKEDTKQQEDEQMEDTTNDETFKSGSNTFLSLQLYARHCFVPAVQAMEALDSSSSNNNNNNNKEEGKQEELLSASPAATTADSSSKKLRVLEGLEDKIRELDVALGQCRRTALGQIPQVLLQAHPIVTAASVNIPSSGKLDLEALGLQSKLEDDAFLNEVQSGVTHWITQIRKVTVLPSTTPFPSSNDDNDPNNNADLEEVSFWSALEVAIQNVKSELHKPQVLLTIALLKAAKRFLPTIALQNNTGLDAAESHTVDVANYLRHFPIQSLAAARDWDKISNAMDGIFLHLPKVRQSRYYDLERCAKLLEATTLTLRQRIDITLRSQYKQSQNIILKLSFDQFQTQVHFPTQDIFVRFEDQYSTFQTTLTELGRRRTNHQNSTKTMKQILDSITLYHTVLRDRLEAIHHFRAQHEKLRAVVTEVLLGQDNNTTTDTNTTTNTSDDNNVNKEKVIAQNAVREVDEAPIALFATVDVLDLTGKGNAAFDAALERYDRKMDAMEERLAKLLRDKLTQCQDAEDMFRVFARFNPLLSRNRVRIAVKEFQMQLISTVGDAVQKLQSKFTHKYESSSASRISKLRGIPPVSGKIMWAKQMERQVHALMKRMGDVLGTHWGQHLEGRQLRRAGDELLTKLDAKAFFRAWVTDWERELSSDKATGRLNTYPIIIVNTTTMIAGRSVTKLIPKVNFDEKYEYLFREIRHLKWLGFDKDIPRTLQIVAEESLARYPHAMALKSALRSFTVVRDLITPELEPLVDAQLKAIQESIAEAFDVSLDGTNSGGKKLTSAKHRRVRWDTQEMAEWVAALTELVSRFEERVESLLRACDKVDLALSLLEKVEFEAVKFQNVVKSIQKIVDQLSLAGYTDLVSWVNVVDNRMGIVLCNRLEEALIAWTETFQIQTDNNDDDDFVDNYINDDEKKTLDVAKTKKTIQIPKIMVEILLRNQEISASPPVPSVRSIFLDELHDYMGTVCLLPRPTSGRFEVFDTRTGADTSSSTTDNTTTQKTFHHLPSLMKPEVLANAYSVIESHMVNFSKFVSQWLAYQTLWDTRASDAAAIVGEDMDRWQKLLLEAADARNALDATPTLAGFGPIVVKYDKIQSQINLKYDSWQRELQSCYAGVLGQRIHDLHEAICEAKTKLENITLEGTGSTTSEIVLGVTYIQEMKQKIDPWGAEVKSHNNSERLLKRQRHTFRSDWMECTRLVGQYQNFQQILEKRSQTMEEQMPLLQSRVLAEDKLCWQRTSKLLSEWEEQKPLQGNMKPQDANEILTKFEFSMKKSKLDYDNILKAKDALGLEVTATDSVITNCLEELVDLKEVWQAVSGPYETLEKLKETPWATAAPRKIRQGLEDINGDLRALPNRVRQFDSYTYFNTMIKNYLGGYGILSDLKTEALKDRHWKSILTSLNIKVPFSELTVGMLWDNGLTNRKKEMNEILTVAQGEMALEVFLNQVRDRWMKQELDLVLYQNRVRLIKGWDSLFGTLDDHMGGLVLMKSSPYYRTVREFQEEGKLWEDRLTKLRGAFDSWVDVQRRWVYLEGIFFGSADIKAQLPSEWSRFKSVDSEFVNLMRRISSRPYAMEALSIENLQRTLERLGNLMTIIQRALGEYLAKQRNDFSRFYFLGDDDLLEIIGNAGEPGKVLAHVGKMFAGINTARNSIFPEIGDENLAVLDAMVSKDGEVVMLDKSITVTAKIGVKDWLKQLEDGMHSTLAKLLESAVHEDSSSEVMTNDEGKQGFINWAKKFPAQVMILATLINWSMSVSAALLETGDNSTPLKKVLSGIEEKLNICAKTVLLDLPSDLRKKFEQLITELVHQRDVTRSLIEEGVSDSTDFRWLYHLRFNYNPLSEVLMEKLSIELSNAKFFYGFEYLGIGERLVQTPLTDRCYLTLTQALRFRMGGNPFGPAGTGKTESVKALGSQLGRFVVVMNCDETFDFGAMGRIFCGLCQVGAWGCFDEFNRLEERILSAVSQQILSIQRGLIERQSSIELLGRSIQLHENVGIFVTMNPGYAGRSNLPDNLKTLFRSVAMVVPDRKLIAQVMLYSQGIVSAEILSGKVVDLFLECESQMSKQNHYDFGLRALKTLLVSAGGLKRKALETEEDFHGENLTQVETEVMVEGICNNVIPKLVAEDSTKFSSILEQIFPGSQVRKMEDVQLKEELNSICEKENLCPDENWVQKILQLKQVIEMRHGIMLVGPTGVGKSSAIKVLLKALEKSEGVKGELYVIEPKAIDKEGLYGALDGTTMDWTDGVFTSILRRILANQKGEAERRHWIVFDGDVDPEWAENLNSVLDDNKLLTLPSGERLSIPDNLKIILEVDSLEQATPATVSRCGMIWFSEENITMKMCLTHMMLSLRSDDLVGNSFGGSEFPLAQKGFLDSIQPFVIYENERSTSLVEDAIEFALEQVHIMPPTRDRLLKTLKALLVKGIMKAIDYDENHPDFPMSGDHMAKFAKKWLLHSLLWSFCGSASWNIRQKFGDFLLRSSGMILPSEDYNLADYMVRVDDGEYELWSDSVPRIEIESHKVTATDIVITTTDTIRHSDVLGAWLSSRLPLILCGPPGSGKTMTLTSVLQSMQGIVLASLNFSSRTTPEIIMKTFSQYCSYVRRGKDIVLEPSESLGAQSWLVIFCDEINLPENDSYGTQRVIMFMRQLVEQGGFWRDDNTWIRINRIQFVGACNPPTDAGREVMSQRFLRHAPLLLVDFPSRDSLMQIYSTFNGGMMKLFPNLKGETKALTEAMVEVYSDLQSKFTPEIQPQYFYSPRELSRWVRGMYESVVHMDQGLTREELVRIWAHESLRLFCDRMVEESERSWCEEKIDEVARKYFAGVDHDIALQRPLFYSTWLSKENKRVSREELREFLSARLRVFYEEELDVPLVIFDEVLDHILRIDRVLRQPMGHCLLVGDSGAGKTVLSKFVSWMNGLSIFQIKAHSKYGMDEFNEDLRSVMRRVGIEGEKICFIFDESNALGSGFLEAMNALLASGEVPGLFEGDEYTALMSACRDSASRDGVIVDSEDELWRRFTGIVQRNLHVVFTMNPSGGEWKTRSTTSPALFNRCVVDWFGTWSTKAMAEVGKQFTVRLDMGDAESVGGSWGIGEGDELMKKVQNAFEGVATGGLRQAVVAALVNMHDITKSMADECANSSIMSCRTFLSPRDYLALIHNFVDCVNRLRSNVEDEQLHVNAGLSKLRQTQDNVAELKIALSSKKKELREKESLANQKLQQMVNDQNIAEKRKEEAEQMSEEVEKQQIQINARKEEAQRDLDEAEPALISAKAAVKGIKKRDLDEVRNLMRPPKNVQLTLECVAIMLGEKKTEWSDVRKLLSKADFIPSILSFDVDKLTARQVKIVEDNYVEGNKDLTVESVSRSSKACGPLYKWAASQIKYSSVYNRVQPLREEVSQLEEDAKIANEKKDSLEKEVAQLEGSILQYKHDYASLIRDVEALKSEMIIVTTKVDRAESLIKSLSHESERWSKSSEGFQQILRSIVGDGLLMAAFLTYSGFFDFKTRLSLMKKWHSVLDTLGIEYRDGLSMIETLSKASDRLVWQSQGLPSDSLSMENGVILDHCVRFPLIIDPAGQALEFIMNKYKDQKIQKTSFLDDSFMKTLAGAIRFGTTLLVENVEVIDPVLNPILNKEIQRTGGRSLVRIGTEDVDYSPKFNIILTTKNPAAKLTPDLCSRVTLVNFTVTPDSLQSQSTSLILKAEKPEIEEQRSNLLKLQGEQLVKLRELEEQMLSTISAVEGNILDDDKVVEGMEVLMKEGSQVEDQIAKSSDIMKEVKHAIGKFEPLAVLCRELFVLVEAMRKISFLYEFSAKSFMNIMKSVLKNAKSEGQSDEERIILLKNHLNAEAAARIARGLSVEDKFVFAILLSKVQSDDIKIPNGGDLTLEAIEQFIESTFGKSFEWQGRGLNHLKIVTESEVDSTVPLMLCNAPGHDVSGRVEAMARQDKKELTAVAMGSAEGFVTAEKLIVGASKRGTWVMLKNCHLCTEWLQDTLVKKVQSFGLGTHPDFRLFITCEINSKLPTSLLRLSDKIVAEAPTGVKASLSRFFSSIPSDRLQNPVTNRLYMVLGWIHAVIQERLRYVPAGWSQSYEFTEADALHALDVIDALVEDTTGGRKNVDPEKLPWDALRSTLCKSIFGGRITKDIDQNTLDNLVCKVFNSQCFDVNFKLVDIDNCPCLPDGSSAGDCFSWVESLPSQTPPAWIGLDGTAEMIRSKFVAKSIIEKVEIVQSIFSDE